MFWHHLIISWRNVVKHKFYSLILVLGFAIGIASSALLISYSWDELSYDNFHAKKDRIFLVGVDSKNGDEEGKSGWTAPPTGTALKDYFPEVENFARVCLWYDEVLVTQDDQQFIEKKLLAVDSTIFEIFSIPFIAGNSKTALTKPNSIVLTEAAAIKYFGEDNPLGKTLQFNQFFNECTVTGVVENYPENSHLDFEILLSLSSFKAINFDFEESWGNHTFSTYVLLNKHVNSESVSAKFPGFLKAKLEPTLIKNYQKTYEEMYAGGDRYTLFLASLEDIHLSTLVFENREGKKLMTYAVGTIGVIIILLICINFINLTTAISMRRIKEIGIRKVSGSSKAGIIRQLLIESVLIVFIGLVFALFLIELTLPYFNNLSQKAISFNYFDPKAIVGFVSLALLMGIISGLYPALKLSYNKPVYALKGKVSASGSQKINSTLLIFQFVICIFMMVGTAMVYKQLSFMSNKNLGFDKEHILVIKRTAGLKDNQQVFKKELLKSPLIKHVSYANTLPGKHFDGHGQHFLGDPVDKWHTIFPLVGDEDITKTLGLEIMEGRGFEDQDTNRKIALLNEAAVNKLQIKTPLEQKIDNGTLGEGEVEIIGVVKDFHFQSFNRSIDPLVIYLVDANTKANLEFVLIKLRGKDISQTLEFVEDKWQILSNNYLFEYAFLDEEFNKVFEREQVTSKVYTTFSVISIFIACLGLLGLASFYAEKRKKEIGIRKINGAGISQIMSLLNHDFIKWISVSFLIATPIAWYTMTQWLENFAYKTELSWWVFGLAGSITLLVALLTVSWQSYLAANANPIDALKNE